MKWAAAVLAVLFIAACSADSGELRIERYASANPGSVNTYWIHAPEGLVVIDAQRSLTDARRVVAKLKETGEPVVAILITHAHPDHVGGIGVLHEAFPEAPIYASEATTTHIRTDPKGFYELTRQQPDADYPAKMTVPDHVIQPARPLEVGGLTLETAEFGPGEHEAATVFHEPKSGALFPGDIVSTHATPALLEGRTCDWLGQLDELQARFPHARTAYPGHGAPESSTELIGAQRKYLTDFRALVALVVEPSSPGGVSVTPDELGSVKAEVNRRYPDHPPVASLATIMDLNVTAVAGELATALPCTA